MSKRYGRRQRRKARETIRNLELSSKHMNVLLNNTIENLKESQDTIDEMVRIIASVCEYSVALPPKSVDGCSNLDIFRVSSYEDTLPFVVTAEPSNHFNPRIKYIDIYALRAYLNDNRETFNKAVHLYHTGVGGESTYMISDYALETMPKEYIVNRLVPEITNKLVSSLQRTISNK